MPGPLLRYFTLDEAVAVEALAERIFPETDERGGASAAHVTEYIDGQLAGPWGQGERMYRHAPFVQPDHAGHGWQSPFTPREAYRYCIDAVERYCVAHFKGHFVVDLTDNELDTLLEALEMGAVDTFEQFAPRDFFDLFLANVNEGLFSDPIYGGNHDCIGWQWIGYPGDPNAYGEPYAVRFGGAEPYDAEPKGLPSV